MSGRTHAMVPAGLSALLFQGDPLLTLTAALAGLAPDIDEPWSVIGQRFWFLSWWIKYLVGHRTLSHSLMLIPLVGVVGIVCEMAPMMIVAILVGVGTHVVLDGLSGGVFLWWPSKVRWVLGRYPVYGRLDQLLMGLGLVCAVAGILMRIQTELVGMRLPG